RGDVQLAGESRHGDNEDIHDRLRRVELLQPQQHRRQRYGRREQVTRVTTRRSTDEGPARARALFLFSTVDVDFLCAADLDARGHIPRYSFLRVTIEHRAP